MLKFIVVLPLSSLVDRASATKTVDRCSIYGRIKPKAIKKMVFIASLLDFSKRKGQCEASTVCGRQVAALLEVRNAPIPYAVDWSRQLGE